MSQPPPEPAAASERGPTAEPTVTVPTRGRGWRWQVSLRTVFLLVAAVGVWTAYFVDRDRRPAIEQRIKVLEPLAHELIVDDPSQFAAVRLEEYWHDDNRWSLYLPPGDYRLCLATRKVDPQNRTQTEPTSSVPIPAGRNVLVLEQTRDKEANHIELILNGDRELTVDETLEWDPGAGSMSQNTVTASTQAPASKPFTLFHRVFTERAANGSSVTPTVPSNGVQIWVEPVTTPVSPAPPAAAPKKIPLVRHIYNKIIGATPPAPSKPVGKAQ